MTNTLLQLMQQIFWSVGCSKSNRSGDFLYGLTLSRDIELNDIIQRNAAAAWGYKSPVQYKTEPGFL